MLSFGALNATSADDSSNVVFREVQKEEQEAAALLLYNDAIAHEKSENTGLLIAKLLTVLDSELIKQAPESLEEGDVLVDHPALFLKYNVLKKLAKIFENNGNNEKAIDYYLQAAVVDESDVTVWWKVGQLSMITLNLRLARFAFEKGLIYSSNHWLCLDNLISVLYIVGDYATCLEMIAKTFERDERYTKGFAFRDQIFKEEPHFKKDFVQLEFLFLEDEDYDEITYQVFVEEALIIRGKRRLLVKREELSKIKVSKPLSNYSWSSLGEIILQTYAESTEGDENQSLSVGVDLSRYSRTPEQQVNLPLPSPEVSTRKQHKTSAKDTDGIKALKRKKLNLTASEKEIEPQPKRRSTRVKLSKAKDNDVNWNELVYSYLPFKPNSTSVTMETDDSQESIPETLDKKTVMIPVRLVTIEDFKTEAVAVSNFINSHAKNVNCITLMEEFLMKQTDHWNIKWRHGMNVMFVNMFKKYKKHTFLPNVLCPDVDQQYLSKLAKVILLALEFEFDSWVQLNGGITTLGIANLNTSTNQTTETSKFLSDLHYISMLAANNDVLIDDTSQEYVIRYFYLHGRFCMMYNDKRNAVNSLYNCIDSLAKSSLDSILLHNCKVENIISKENVEKIINSLQQSQTLDQLQQIFEAKRYVEIISFLEASLIGQNKKVGEANNQPERSRHMFMLIESFFCTKDFKKCLKCISVALDESTNSSAFVEAWKLHLNAILMRFDSYFTSDDAKVFLTREYLQQISDKLIKVMEISMDSDQSSDSVTTLPWLLLYRIIKWWEEGDEEKNKKAASDVISKDGGDSNHDEDESNESNCERIKLDFMRDAHEYLGKKHWCCHDDGRLLSVFVNDAFELLQNKVNVQREREMILKDLEQCFFCLYSNPCKKSKTKALSEHSAQAITLTWENAHVLYRFYRPDGLPRLDVKAFTITVETQHVFRKIVTVVPQKEIELIPFETLQQFIDGGESLPTVKSGLKKNTMEDLFYYLGDFYLKNKEFSKALKFYMHDVCVMPNRFQSWAAMAVIRASRLEEKLNQCELKGDGLVKKLITSTLRCFEKAVAIDNKKCLILEEYGQTAYMLNSYASRKLKEAALNEKIDALSFEHYRSMKKEMLQLTEKCFLSALQAATTSKEGEHWLHYYMLGKTSEKLNKPASVFFEYYQKSLSELYISGGEFTKKITYRFPPEYSIESVELFYRIHASILKLLKYSDDADYTLLLKHLNIASKQQIYLDIQETDLASLKETESSSIQSTKELVTSKPFTCKGENNSSSDDDSRDVIDQLLSDLLSAICNKEIEKYPSDSGTAASINQSKSNSDLLRQSCGADDGNSDVISKEIMEELLDKVESRCNVIETKASQVNAAFKITAFTLSRDWNQKPADHKTSHNFSQNSNETLNNQFNLNSKNDGMNSTVDVKPTLDSRARSAEISSKRMSENKFPEKVVNVHDTCDKNFVVFGDHHEMPDNVSIRHLIGDLITHVEKSEKQMCYVDRPSNETLNNDNIIHECLQELVNKVCETINVENDNITEKSETDDMKCKQQQALLFSSPGNKSQIDAGEVAHKKILSRTFKTSDEKDTYETIACRCLQAFGFCLRRFPEHYKSQYTMAYFLTHSSLFENLQWSRDLLLGNNTIGQTNYSIPLPVHGIFSGKKKTNLFQYMWRIPSNEIDRPGSFCTHNNQSIDLLLTVLYRLKDHALLIHVSAFLHKTPDKERKYLRDNDRALLAVKAFDMVLDILKNQMNKICSQKEASTLLMDIYEAYKHAQKLQISQQRTELFLVKVYNTLKSYDQNIDVEKNYTLDETLKFCQQRSKPT